MGTEVNNAEEMLEKIFDYMSQLVDNQNFESNILVLTEMGKTLVHSERASFWYWDEAKKQYWTVVALESERIVVPQGSGIVGAAIEGGETICINNPYEDPRFLPEVDKKTGFVTKSILCMPVKNSKGRVIGAYQAINKIASTGEDGFDEKDEKRLAMAAVFCGKILESQILDSQSQVDPLTKLKNRRGFYDYYTTQLKEDIASGTASIIMCDIDFFKKVNDTYGHNAGDAVLVMVANTLKEMAGQQGEVVRWGGEEFIILLQGCLQEDAYELAESIRKHMEKSVCNFEGQTIKVTMSFGVSSLLKGKTSDENVENVDQKLYQAKTTGRNKTII